MIKSFNFCLEILRRHEEVHRESHVLHEGGRQRHTSPPKVHHAQTDHIEPTVPSKHSIHGSETGSIHPHEFRVDTAHHTLAGHGDGPERLREAHSHDLENPVSNTARPSIEEENAAWNAMTHALRTLHSMGFDMSIADALLPMLETRIIYRDWVVDMKAAYHHIQHRLKDDWKASEPSGILPACREFLYGYDVISEIYLGLK
jgi:hypothetical protein